MKRLELIANQSVKDELLEALENALPDIEYTLLPIVQGKGRQKRKEGTRTWPETNFLLISYMGEEDAVKAAAAIVEVRKHFPDEGIFASSSESTAI
jgi:nitrogen regulatory protein PII